MSGFFQDLRCAFRVLGTQPAFSTAAIFALSLGIGMNTAIFSVVERVLLRPLPFRDSSRLYALRTVPKKPSPFEIGTLSDPLVFELRKSTRLFDPLVAYNTRDFSMTGAGDALHIRGTESTADLFQMLDVGPALGRTFLQEEGRPERNNVVILSDRLWRSRFDAGRDILGRKVNLDGKAYTITGVMPPGFMFPNNAELWVPTILDSTKDDIAFRQVIARLAPGASLAQATAEVNAINDQVVQRSRRHDGVVLRATPLHELVTGKVRNSLLVFLGAVGCVLLIACVNVANLLLVRSAGRRQEIAIRTSLGASRVRLVRQLLTESVVLGLIAGVAGVIIAVWGVDALTILAPPDRIPRLEEVRLDGWALAFTFAVSILTGILFGLAPAMQATQRNFAVESARADVSSQRGGTLRSALVVSEIAIALVLLIGAGLLIRSFVRLRSVDLGFKTDHVVTATIELPDRVYDSAAKMHSFQDDLLARVSHLPGVTAGGLVNWLPLGNALISGDFVIEGQPAPKNAIAAKPVVSPGYFRAMGIRVLRGRSFSDRDTASSEPVAIVDESFARRFWPGQDPVGKRISVADDPKPDDWMTVVGVVESIHQESPGAPKSMALYQPSSQVQVPFFLQTATVVLRSDANLQAIASALRASVREVDRNQPIRTLATMDELLDASTAEQRFHTRLLGLFSAVALLLAMIGIYGVIAYSVTQRTREIGVRMAVGAQAADILKLIIGRSAMLVAAGIALGTAGAFAATRVLKNFLFEVNPTDPATFAGVALLLALIALFASYLPARRASRIDPMTALRWE